MSDFWQDAAMGYQDRCVKLEKEIAALKVKPTMPSGTIGELQKEVHQLKEALESRGVLVRYFGNELCFGQSRPTIPSDEELRQFCIDIQQEHKTFYIPDIIKAALAHKWGNCGE